MKSPPQNQCSGSSIPPYEPRFILGSDEAGKARRLKLHDMTREAFPDGKILDPFTTAWPAEDAAGTVQPIK